MKTKILSLRRSKRKEDRMEALKLVKEFLDRNPLDIECWYAKAGCHDFLGEEKIAETCYQKVYDLDWRKLSSNDQRSFFVGFGSTLRNNLDLKKSEIILEEGIENFPNYPALKVFLALTLYSLKKEHLATLKLFNAILESSKKGLDGYENALKWYIEKL